MVAEDELVNRETAGLEYLHSACHCISVTMRAPYWKSGRHPVPRTREPWFRSVIDSTTHQGFNNHSKFGRHQLIYFHSVSVPNYKAWPSLLTGTPFRCLIFAVQQFLSVWKQSCNDLFSHMPNSRDINLIMNGFVTHFSEFNLGSFKQAIFPHSKTRTRIAIILSSKSILKIPLNFKKGTRGEPIPR